MTAVTGSIVVERMLNASPDAVWAAITVQAQMVKWFFDNIPAFEPHVGFHTRFDVDSGKRIFPHLWTIIEAVPRCRIVYDWRYDGYNGVSQLTMSLHPEASGATTFRVCHEVLEPFDDNIPEFQPDSCRVGWEHFIGRLAAFVETV